VSFGLRKTWILTKNDGLEIVFPFAGGLELMEKKNEYDNWQVVKGYFRKRKILTEINL